MKKFKIAMGMVAITLTFLTVTSCKDTKKSDEHMEMNQDEMNHDGDMNMEKDQNGMKNDEMMNRDQKTSKATAVLNSYLELKNALVADNTEVAATDGKTCLLYTSDAADDLLCV